jgi:hypothetical protein
MPYGYEDIGPIPNFKSKEEEYAYAREKALAYFRNNVSAEYCMWENNGKLKYLFISDVFGGIYESHRLGEKVE